MDHLIEEIESKGIGQSIELGIIRDKKQKTTKVKLTEMPVKK